MEAVFVDTRPPFHFSFCIRRTYIVDRQTHFAFQMRIYSSFSVGDVMFTREDDYTGVGGGAIGH